MRPAGRHNLWLFNYEIRRQPDLPEHPEMLG